MISNLQDLKKVIMEYNGNIESRLLYPVYDTAKSFYNKAEFKRFYTNDLSINLLYSYNTLVCGIVEHDGKIKYILNTDIASDLLFSNTTLRHIKEFLIQNVEILRLSHLIDGKIRKADIIKSDNKILN